MLPHRSTLVDEMKTRGAFGSPAVERAFRLIDRAHFLPDELKSQAHHDQPLRNRLVHHSAPHIYAQVLSSMNIQPDHRFLCIGSGSGYFNSMVATFLGPSAVNHGIDIRQEVVDFAKQRISEISIPGYSAETEKPGRGSSFGSDTDTGDDDDDDDDEHDRFSMAASSFSQYDHNGHASRAHAAAASAMVDEVAPAEVPASCEIQFLCGDGFHLDTSPGSMKYDRIYIAAEAPEECLEFFCSLLELGGMLVAPVDDRLQQVTRVGDGITSQQTLARVRFVPLEHRQHLGVLDPIRFPSLVWTANSHQLFPPSFQRTVQCCVMLQRRDYGLPGRLPLSLWLHIFAFLERFEFQPPVSELQVCRRALAEATAALRKAEQRATSAEEVAMMATLRHRLPLQNLQTEMARMRRENAALRYENEMLRARNAEAREAGSHGLRGVRRRRHQALADETDSDDSNSSGPGVEARLRAQLLERNAHGDDSDDVPQPAPVERRVLLRAAVAAEEEEDFRAVDAEIQMAIAASLFNAAISSSSHAAAAAPGPEPVAAPAGNNRNSHPANGAGHLTVPLAVPVAHAPARAAFWGLSFRAAPQSPAQTSSSSAPAIVFPPLFSLANAHTHTTASSSDRSGNPSSSSSSRGDSMVSSSQDREGEREGDGHAQPAAASPAMPTPLSASTALVPEVLFVMEDDVFMRHSPSGGDGSDSSSNLSSAAAQESAPSSSSSSPLQAQPGLSLPLHAVASAASFASSGGSVNPSSASGGVNVGGHRVRNESVFSIASENASDNNGGMQYGQEIDEF